MKISNCKKISVMLASIVVCASCLVFMTACSGGGAAPSQGESGNITSDLGAAYEKVCLVKINGARDGLPELQNDSELAKEALAALDKIKDGQIAWGDAFKEEGSDKTKTSVLFVATDVGVNEKPTDNVMVNATALTEADLAKMASSGNFAGKRAPSLVYGAKNFASVGVATKVVDGKTYVAIKIVGSQGTSAKDPNK